MSAKTNPTKNNQDSSRSSWGCSHTILAILAVSIGIGFINLGLVGIGAILIVSDPIQPVDAVVVLSGDDGDRLALAIEMHDQGIAPKLVITDTTEEANELLVGEAQRGGFAPGDIILTPIQVRNTVDEARAVRELAQNNGWGVIMVVTDPFHSLRTRIVFRRELRQLDLEVLVRPVVGHWFRSTTWFLHPQGWVFVVNEIFKFFTYFLLGV
jgi:uncharacterized SAM-binding protein YcdF (DUF218 family)